MYFWFVTVEKYNLKSVLIALAILLTIGLLLLWCAHKNSWFEHLKCLPDCCTSVQKCLGRCCSGGTCGCSLRCSQVCMCCVVPPIRDDQPASGNYNLLQSLLVHSEVKRSNCVIGCECNSPVTHNRNGFRSNNTNRFFFCVFV